MNAELAMTPNVKDLRKREANVEVLGARFVRLSSS
jgi:hypothetical protein